MNIKISEKVVSYRLGQKNNQDTKKAIGAIIKNERISQGLNQDYVCKDICSVSYFSRIENNKLTPTNEYVIKFFAKLNKPVPKEWGIKHTSFDVIDNFLSAIEYRNNALIDSEYERIKDSEEIKPELINFVYYINKNNLKEAEVYLPKLHAIQNYFTNEELLLYLEYSGSFYVLSNMLEKAHKFLNLAITLQNNLKLKKPLLLYKYAWVLGRLNQDIKAIEYAEEALQLFNKINNVYRSVQCQLLIAIKYSKNNPSKAIKLYEEIIIVSNHINLSDVFRTAAYNLALLYKSHGNIERSKDMFLMLTQHFNKVDCIDIYYELIDLLFHYNQKEAEKYFEVICDMKVDNEYANIFNKYYDMQFNEARLDSKIDLYCNELIPYSVKTRNTELELRFRKEYLLLLEEAKKLSNCIEEYKKIINIMEHLGSV